MTDTHTRLHRAFDRIGEPHRLGVFLAIGCAAHGLGSGAVLLLIMSRAAYLYGPKSAA